MVGYSGTPLWRKLGYTDGLAARVDGGPAGYIALLELPGDIRVTWLTRSGPSTAFVHVFSTAASSLRTKLESYRERIAPDGIIWVSWPKKSAGVATDITEDTIRAIALPMGLVDVKVCAVDETWSALKLVIRKHLRRPPAA